MPKALRLLLLFFTVFSIFSAQLLHAGGFVLVENNKKNKCATCPPLEHYSLQLKSEKVSIVIDDQQARTTIEQVFYNQHKSKFNGVFYFPIPQGAAMEKPSFFVESQKVNASLLDKTLVMDAYKEWVALYQDPALLAFTNQAAYRLPMNDIEPGARIYVKTVYTETLPKEGNLTRYHYPMNIEKQRNFNIDQLDFKVDINSSEKIKNVYSPTFEIEAARISDHQAKAYFEADTCWARSDFDLFYTVDEKDLGLSLLPHKVSSESAEEEEGFFYLDITPAIDIKNMEVLPKDITFVLDCSGSMVGKKMEQAKRALLYCINNLNPDDRFNIVRFSTKVESLYKELHYNTEKNINDAKGFIEQFTASGGTNIEGALKKALNVKGDPNRPFTVVFITDGKPTIGITKELPLLESVRQNNINNAKIFTFGIGDDLNAHLLDKITEMTKAARAYVDTHEDLEIKLSNFYNKVSSPILTDLQLSISGVETSDVYPQVLPDLFKGSSLVVFGRYKGTGRATVRLDGKMNGRAKSYTFQTDFSQGSESGNDFLPTLWASRRIGFLLDQIRLHGESEALKRQVVQLSREYGVITPYTSYLMMEEQRENESAYDSSQEGSLLQVFNWKKQDDEIISASQTEYDDLRFKKEGAESVRSSKDIFRMNNALSLAQISPGQSRLNFTDNKGRSHNIGEQIRTVGERAFYLQDEEWVDARLSNLPENQPWIEVVFNSLEYYQLLESQPELAQYFSLGRKVKFIHNEVAYVVN